MAKNPLETELEENRTRLAAISRERDELFVVATGLIRRNTEIEASLDIAQKIATLTPAERDAVFNEARTQHIQAQGIPSAEEFGNLGGKSNKK